MSKYKSNILILIISGFLFAFSGCQQHSNTKNDINRVKRPLNDIGLKKISDVADIAIPYSTRVKGVGLVVGLNRTGSSECPPSIRRYMQKFILTQLPEDSKIDPDQLINSPDTAIVTILGVIPTGASKGETFDVAISALSSSQTTSIENGRLLLADLRQADTAKQRTVLATAQGGVYIPSGENKTIGYILGGGTSAKTQNIVLKMKTPDYALTSRIRNKINEKFGPNIANAQNDQLIMISIPDDFQSRKQKYLELLKTIYIDDQAAGSTKLISVLVDDLKHSQDKDTAETTLEMIGKNAADKLVPLLNNPDKEIRFRAARCLLTMGDSRGINILSQTAVSGGIFAEQAIDAIAFNAKRNDAVAILSGFMNADNFDLKLASYKHLSRLKAMSISQKTVETVQGTLSLERIVQNGQKIIWASRSGQPKIVLFGSPIYCEKDLFVQSDDGSIVVSYSNEDGFINLVRQHPKAKNIIKAKTSTEAGLVIRTLAQAPAKTQQYRRQGMGLSYGQLLDFIEKMYNTGAIKAQFVLGDEPSLKSLIISTE